MKSVFESARQRIVEVSDEEDDAVGGSEADGGNHLNLECKPKRMHFFNFSTREKMLIKMCDYFFFNHALKKTQFYKKM